MKFEIGIGNSVEELVRLAYMDYLTGVYSRNLLEALRPNLENYECIVTIVDMDRLKSLNDNHGHEIGDKAIQYIANRLQDISCLVFRLGGDEFLLIDFDRDMLNLARELEKVRGISYGSSIKTKATNLKLAMSMADDAMYFQKKNKKKLNL